MTVGTWQLQDTGLLDLFTEDSDGASYYMVLCTASLTPDDAHDTLSDISANEVGDADYSPQDMTGVSITQTSGTVTIDFDDVSFGTSVTITAKYAYIVRGTVSGKTGTDRLVARCDLKTEGGSLSSTSDVFKVVMHASGMATAVQV